MSIITLSSSHSRSPIEFEEPDYAWRERFSVIVFGEPQPAGSKTVGFRRDGSSFLRPAGKGEVGRRKKEWQETVARMAGFCFQGSLLDGPLRLELVFVRVRPSTHYLTDGQSLSAEGKRHPAPDVTPDLTKLVRAVEDGLQGQVVRNDSRFVDQDVRKRWGSRACVSIRVLVPDDDPDATEWAP